MMFSSHKVLVIAPFVIFIALYVYVEFTHLQWDFATGYSNSVTCANSQRTGHDVIGNVSHRLDERPLDATTLTDYSDSFVRDCLTGSVIGRIPTETSRDATIVPYSVDHRGRIIESSHDRRQHFRRVFQLRIWGQNNDPTYDGVQASGGGSTLYFTQEFIAVLHTVINQLKAKYKSERIHIVDVPCGDLAWMSRFLETRDDVYYTGIDIVPDLINQHRKKFADRWPKWNFLLIDVVHEGLVAPLLNESSFFSNGSVARGSVHLILSRMMIQHLFMDDVLRTLSHFSDVASHLQKPPSPAVAYLLVTTYPGQSSNGDFAVVPNNLKRTQWVNLEIPPISLTPPLCLHRDGPRSQPYGPKYIFPFVGLWKLPLKKVAHCRQPSSINLTSLGSKVYSCINWTSQ